MGDGAGQAGGMRVEWWSGPSGGEHTSASSAVTPAPVQVLTALDAGECTPGWSDAMSGERRAGARSACSRGAFNPGRARACQARADQAGPGWGRAGRGRPGQGRRGQGRPGQRGRAGAGRAITDRAGRGRAGPSWARPDRGRTGKPDPNGPDRIGLGEARAARAGRVPAPVLGYVERGRWGRLPVLRLGGIEAGSVGWAVGVHSPASSAIACAPVQRWWHRTPVSAHRGAERPPLTAHRKDTRSEGPGCWTHVSECGPGMSVAGAGTHGRSRWRPALAGPGLGRPSAPVDLAISVMSATFVAPTNPITPAVLGSPVNPDAPVVPDVAGRRPRRRHSGIGNPRFSRNVWPTYSGG